jgi:hypothetical protein
MWSFEVDLPILSWGWLFHCRGYQPPAPHLFKFNDQPATAYSSQLGSASGSQHQQSLDHGQAAAISSLLTSGKAFLLVPTTYEEYATLSELSKAGGGYATLPASLLTAVNSNQDANKQNSPAASGFWSAHPFGQQSHAPSSFPGPHHYSYYGQVQTQPIPIYQEPALGQYRSKLLSSLAPPTQFSPQQRNDGAEARINNWNQLLLPTLIWNPATNSTKHS